MLSVASLLRQDIWLKVGSNYSSLPSIHQATLISSHFSTEGTVYVTWYERNQMVYSTRKTLYKVFSYMIYFYLKSQIYREKEETVIIMARAELS